MHIIASAISPVESVRPGTIAKVVQIDAWGSEDTPSIDQR